MIRFIAALDSKKGLANNHGIPWQGKLPTDVAYFRSKTINSVIMMGAGWYAEQKQPLPNRRNIVATSSDVPIRAGFEATHNARKFLQEFQGEIWVGGGAGLFTSPISLADELYLTRIDGDFNCTKFFPEFEHDFVLTSQTKPQIENGMTLHFEVWKRK